MKYRTIIELVCDERDEEEAGHIAGEYLKGNVDRGVNMKCRTVPFRRFDPARLSLVAIVIFIAIFAFFLKSDNIEGESRISQEETESK